MTETRDAVNPEQLLKELNALWTEFGATNDDPNGVVRACSLTWITVVEGDDAKVREADEMLADVMRVHPSRAIVVLLREGEERRLKGSVSAQCWRPFGSKQQVCIERVLLDTTRAGACDVPAVIRALVVADLPVVVFCRNAHLLAVEGVRETTRLADRVVVDIAYHDSECRDVWRNMPSMGQYVSDLAWDRLIPFRKAIAEHFASAANRELLSRLSEFRIHTAGERPTPEAAYLFTWVLGKLGYERQGEEWKRDGHAIRAGFVCDTAADSPIGIVEFRAGQSAIHFEPGMTEPKTNGATRMPVTPIPSDTELLSGEMVVERRRRTFEQYLTETIRLFEEPIYLAD